VSQSRELCLVVHHFYSAANGFHFVAAVSDLSNFLPGLDPEIGIGCPVIDYLIMVVVIAVVV
jgi:hypothetical protein